MIAVSKKTWEDILDHCSSFDVEAGETADYKYSVRHKTGTVTVITQQGWKDNFYVCRFVPKGWPSAKRRKYTIEVLPGEPSDKAWPIERAERQLRELVSYMEGQRESTD